MANKKGHWYTDKNGNHYFVEEGQTPQEGWEASKRRKMIDGGKYKVSEDGSEYTDVTEDEYNKYEADETDFDETNEDDFGFDEEDENHMSYEEIFTDNDTKQIEKYANHYGVDVEELKDTIHQNALDRIRQGDSPTNAKNDAMEEELDKLSPGSAPLGDEGEDTRIVSINGQPVEGSQDNKNPQGNSKPKHHYENDDGGNGRHLVVDEGPNAGSYDSWEDYYNSIKDSDNSNSQYKSKYKAEDYEDARYYPVSDEDRKAAGPRYLGRYHSIFDAAGLDDNEPGSWKKANEMFKYVGDSDTGASIVQGPDGYFSGNPRINSMSFKTLEQARDYLDRKNPEEHKYGVYFKPGDEREYMYRDAEDKYDLEAPDAYRNAREAAKYDRIGNIKGKVGDRELSLNELIEKTNKLDDRELARDIIAIQAPKFNLSEKEILDYYDKVGKK